MKFAELINRSNWIKVELELTKEYPDLKKNTIPFRTVYDQLGKLKPVKSQFSLYIRKVETIDENEVDFIAVSGMGELYELDNTYNISAQKWEEWIGMEMHQQSLIDFTKSQIIAYSLYEMTWYGFNHKEINENFNKTIERSE